MCGPGPISWVLHIDIPKIPVSVRQITMESDLIHRDESLSQHVTDRPLCDHDHLGRFALFQGITAFNIFCLAVADPWALTCQPAAFLR